MATTLPGALLAAQHRTIDAGIGGAADGTGDLSALAASLAQLRLHLYVEETLLFPPLAKSGLTMPVFVMQREHGLMWPLLQALDAACAAGQPIAALPDPARELFQLLQMHNPKEEQIVYAAADRVAAGDAEGTLVKAIEGARMPEAWTCAMAPH
ncbi:MAG: hemerythrin domain-containing protein [Proteobacteria bacterium]|nr:hemerythrin domain-containing protein [Pseudomonadota bacterium]